MGRNECTANQPLPSGGSTCTVRNPTASIPACCASAFLGQLIPRLRCQYMGVRREARVRMRPVSIARLKSGAAMARGGAPRPRLLGPLCAVGERSIATSSSGADQGGTALRFGARSNQRCSLAKSPRASCRYSSSSACIRYKSRRSSCQLTQSVTVVAPSPPCRPGWPNTLCQSVAVRLLHRTANRSRRLTPYFFPATRLTSRCTAAIRRCCQASHMPSATSS